MKATFFLLGSRAEAAPDIVDRLVSSGQELGCHGQDHVHAWKSGETEALEDIEAGYRSLEGWVGGDAVFRPPYGKLLRKTRKHLKQRGAPIGWWTVDSGDTWAKLPEVDDVVRSVVDAGGGVVLMHDFERESAAADAIHGFVLSLTEALIQSARDHQIDVLPLGRLMDQFRENE